MSNMRNDPDSPEGHAADADNRRYIGGLNFEAQFKERDEERGECIDDDGHDWLPIGSAGDGTTFYRCRRCRLESEG